MIADLLLRPDNRLLGGATGDFSLFGGQPTLGVTFARENAANGLVSITARQANDAPSGGSMAGPATTTSFSDPAQEIPAARDGNAGVFSGADPASPPAGATPDPSAPALDDLVPTALSSGGLAAAGFAALGLASSIPMPPPAGADAASNPLIPSGASFDAPTLDQLVPTIGALTATIAPISDIVSDLADVAATVTDDVIDPLATGVADAVDPVLAPVADTVAPVVDGVVETIAPVTSGVTVVAAPAVATITDVAAPVVAAVAPAVDPVIDAVAPVVNAATPVVDAVSPVVVATAPATAPIVDAVQPAGVMAQPAVDPVAAVAGEALGGSDPEGGVQTLVGMVANADAFDVIAPGTASAEEPSPSVIDDLIGDVSEVAPLLGNHDGAHDDDATDLFGGHGGLGLG